MHRRAFKRERTGAFITLGDPAVYSTFMYTLPYIEAAGVEVEVVPGITSFCAAADSMKMPLVAWNEDLVVAPVRKNSSEDLGRVLREHDNVVLMKPSTDPGGPAAGPGGEPPGGQVCADYQDRHR